jgi:S1-C subfamily serine protease
MGGVIAVLVILLIGLSSAQPQIQELQVQSQKAPLAGGAQAVEPKFRLLRSVSGSKGSEQGGVFVVADPRTVFYVPEDAQIVAYFEWEGPLGTHQLEGVWKNPEGKVVVLSDFKYEAKQRRFGAYWTLKLSETVPSGVWTIESRIDGELAGTHTFQILLAPRPASALPGHRVFSPAEIYRRALEASVFLERLDANGERLGTGTGFFVGATYVVTGFEVVDAASSVRLILSDGRRLLAQGLAGWNRREDWAVLSTPLVEISRLPLAKPNSWAVGDRCYALDVPQEWNRIIVDGNITGQQALAEFGPRLNLSFSLQSQASGSPAFNEYGEVIGIAVRHSMLPGSASLDVLGGGFPMNLLSGGTSFLVERSLAVPISLVSWPAESTPPTPFAELFRTSQFVAPLVRYRNILRGTLALGLDKKGTLPQAVDEKFQFTRRDGEIVVYLMWDPKERIKSAAYCRMYNLDNRLLADSKPLKVNLNPGRTAVSSWRLAIATLPPGIYRVDVVLDASPVWRTFFRIAE